MEEQSASNGQVAGSSPVGTSKYRMKNLDARMVFGFGVLLVMATLAGAIALGKVHQESSFGLQYLLGGLNTLAGVWATWAFNNKENSNGREEKDTGGHRHPHEG